MYRPSKSDRSRGFLIFNYVQTYQYQGFENLQQIEYCIYGKHVKT